MFLSGSFIGVSVFQSIEGTNIPLRRAYSKVKIYGNAIIDKLHIRNIELDNENIRNIVITDNLKWDINTLLMAEFENNLVGGNIANLVNPITQWQINRREVSGSTLEPLGDVDVGVNEFIDYTSQQGKNYVYSVYANSNTEQSEPLEADEISTDYFGYYLVDEDQGMVYKFDLNIQSSAKQYNEDVTISKSYSKYPTISQGQSRYFSTKLTCICGTVDINGKLQQSINYIDNLCEFILNGKQKIFKTRRGEIYRIYTSNYSEQQLDDGIQEQIILISFDITEVASI